MEKVEYIPYDEDKKKIEEKLHQVSKRLIERANKIIDNFEVDLTFSNQYEVINNKNEKIAVCGNYEMPFLNVISANPLDIQFYPISRDKCIRGLKIKMIKDAENCIMFNEEDKLSYISFEEIENCNNAFYDKKSHELFILNEGKFLKHTTQKFKINKIDRILSQLNKMKLELLKRVAIVYPKT